MPPLDPTLFRHVLGHYPTGVSIVTTLLADGSPAGMVVGSFTSVSLDPPLVGFFPARNSGSWARISTASRFCINVLGDNQEELCRRFASRIENKFEGISHAKSEFGMPVLDQSLAWVDCSLYALHDAGDHVFVLGQVDALGAGDSGSPLIFFRGGYGRYVPLGA